MNILGFQLALSLLTRAFDLNPHPRVLMQPDPDEFDQILDRSLEHHRAGKPVGIDELCEQYPQHADELRRVLPVVLLLERRGDESDGATSDITSTGSNTDGYQAPTQLDDYRIIRQIGRGGMGIVYEAEQLSLGRRVALKVLPGDRCASASAVRRFKREAKSAARMHHSNIVPVFDVGETEDVLYYAMQLIDGRSLDFIINDLSKQSTANSQLDAPDQGGETTQANATPGESIDRPATAPSAPEGRPLPIGLLQSVQDISPDATQQPNANVAEIETRSKDYWRAVANIGIQVADALAYSHQRGIIHRDIKPSNLILDPAGVVWVTDFGLATSNQAASATNHGSMVGTLRYMAPEQISGRSDERSDVYSLGISLYELLTLNPAFLASNHLQLADEIRTTTPITPRLLDPRIPRDLETIVLKACDKTPASRYGSPLELSDDLRRFLDDQPIKARRTPQLERFMRWARRNRALAVLLPTVVALLLVIAIGAILARRQALDMAALNRRNLYFAEMTLAGNAAGQPGGIRRVRELLSNWIPKPGENDLRGAEWFYLNGLGNDATHCFQGHSAQVYGVAFSPGGKSLASVAGDGRLIVWALPSGSQTLCVETKDRLTDVAWSPKGTAIAIGGDGGNIDLIAPDGAQLGELRANGAKIRSIAFSPDGRHLASGCVDGVWLWELESGNEPVAQFVPTGGDANQGTIQEVRWHADGRRICSISEDGSLSVWDVDSRTLCPETSNIRAAEYLDDWIGNEVFECNPAGDQMIAGSVRLVHLRRSADGSTFSSQIHQPLGGPIRAARWTSDGKCLVTGGEGLELFIHDGSDIKNVVAKLRGHVATITDIAIAPGDQSFATASEDGSVRVWSLPKSSVAVAAPRDIVAAPVGNDILCTGGGKRALVLYHPESGRQTHCETALPWNKYADWNDNSRLMVIGGTDDQRSSIVEVIDSTTRKRIRTVDVNASILKSLSLHPHDPIFATSSNIREDGVEIWNAANGERAAHLDVPCWVDDALSWRNDGKYLACAGWTIFIVDRESFEIVHRFNGHKSNLTAIAFSPDGKRLASASADGTTIINSSVGDPTTWQPTTTLRGHTGVVLAIAWSPDNRRLATTSRDGTLKLWDAESGQQTLSVNLDSPGCQHICWTADGRFLAASVDDSLRTFFFAGYANRDD